jgi:DNA-binding NarL/FixJ family response regulator
MERITEKKNARILIVDDHAVVRQGLRMLINQELDLLVSGEAEDGETALRLINTQHFDLAIVDISLNGESGIQLTEKIKVQRSNLPVLILTMHDEKLYARQAFRAGARGYITKHEAAETIITAIRMMLSGKDYIGEQMAKDILCSMVSAKVHS